MSIPERRKRERVAVSFGATGTAKLKGSGSMLLTIPSGTAVFGYFRMKVGARTLEIISSGERHSPVHLPR